MSISPQDYQGQAAGIRLSDEGLALLNVLLELGQARVEQLLLLGGDGTDGVDLLNTVKLKKMIP